MNIKLISYNNLGEAIYVAFDGDNKIKDFYDPNVKISSIDELVNDVLRKIKEYGLVSAYSVCEEDITIGYIVNIKSHLISFGISYKYRSKEHLKIFFDIIKNKLGKNFFTILWRRNIRAIKWLIKNGLMVTYFDDNLIKLQCQ